MLAEFAVWPRAVLPWRDRRFSAFEHCPSCCHDGFTGEHETLRVRRHISIEEADAWIQRQAPLASEVRPTAR